MFWNIPFHPDMVYEKLTYLYLIRDILQVDEVTSVFGSVGLPIISGIKYFSFSPAITAEVDYPVGV